VSVLGQVLPIAAEVAAPEIDYRELSPLIALVTGTVIVLMVGLAGPRFPRTTLVPLLTAATILTAMGLTIWIWEPGDRAPIIEGALSMDALALGVSMLFYVAGLVAIALSLREPATDEAGHGEFYSLLLGSITGMVVLAAAENLITVFIGLELLSIPLYVLCATRLRQRDSLEAGLKYLVIGSVGSATLLYGLAMVYGAAGSMQFSEIAAALGGEELSARDPLLLTGIALCATGLAFKASVAPFHQWTPDVYQGAPTPITTFMAVATKAAAFAVFLRLFGHALGLAQLEWAPALAALATVTIVIGNVGAIAQRSLKRMLAWSSVAQAGYLLAGVVVGSELGVRATAFYLAVYLAMNVAAFAVVVARERVSEHGDDLASFEDLGTTQPWLAWPMTIAMLSLAGFPATGGFIGKFYLIDATVSGDYTWLGIAIVIGSVISLVYYLRVIAVMWMGRFEVELPRLPGRPSRTVKPVAGWSPEADVRAQPEVAAVAIAFAVVTVLLGLWPDPLFEAARDVGTSISSLR
jgi:NADH-quinone oxidoreductase subunit N